MRKGEFWKSKINNDEQVNNEVSFKMYIALKLNHVTKSWNIEDRDEEEHSVFTGRESGLKFDVERLHVDDATTFIESISERISWWRGGIHLNFVIIHRTIEIFRCEQHLGATKWGILADNELVENACKDGANWRANQVNL